MSDAWLVRIDDSGGTRYLYEYGSEVWVPYPEDAAKFTYSQARAAIRKIGYGSAVRRFEELRERGT